MSSTDDNQTSSTLQNIKGHAQYVLGAGEGAIASATSSDSWSASAEQNKQEGIQTIRDASSTDDASNDQSDSLAAKACPVVGGGVGQTGSDGSDNLGSDFNSSANTNTLSSGQQSDDTQAFGQANTADGNPQWS
ncbi:hypothetical protein OC846_005113 [Tilletia horrida]|uniref:Uncharacterized protein n=1 Tax=Tilletia horrida TaxID=155126 RepID=A0AAN6GLE3_9BASI|nr:hypothetical protein OC846_005113 [Tilletia horrida]KAK0562395.1 hypothetical protein OC861_005334 [Tilletia horrida]